ncbi:hypothetical protein EMIT0357P_80068 [Pseudomonas marginalis]
MNADLFVGGGLLPIAVCQPAHMFLMHRYRGQAPSHTTAQGASHATRHPFPRHQHVCPGSRQTEPEPGPGNRGHRSTGPEPVLR